jgi:hypothetical protein
MQYNKKEQILDVVKDFLGWVVVTAVAFVWWLAVLLIFSLILMSIWNTSFEAILRYSIAATIISSLVYLIWLIYRRVGTKNI